MGKMKQIYTETQELLDAVLNLAGDELVKDQPSEGAVVREMGRYLQEQGWLSPTEADALLRNARDNGMGGVPRE